MALLRYRISSTPALPTQTEVLTQGLTSLQIDANFKSLDSAKVERVGEETITGSLTVDNIKTDGNVISSVNTDGNIELTPNGAGDVYLNADTVRIGDADTAVTFTTNGTGNLTINTNSGTNSGSILINQGANGNIELTPNGTGDVYLNADTVRVGDSNAAATITTNGTGNLTLSTNAGTNSGTVLINNGANGNIDIEPNGTGDVNLIADTVRLGSTNEDSVVTTNGTADLTLNTNAGTNSGSIKIFDGVNGVISIQTNGTGEVVVNDGGNAADFRVEGDTDANLLIADASADRVGIGTATPTAKLNVEGTVIVNDGGGDFDVRVEGDNDVNLFFTDASTDRVAVGTNTPENKLHIQQTSAATNTVTDVLRLDSQSTGTPANGIGVGMEFAVETSAGNTEVGAAIEAVTTDVTATSEDFDLVFRTMIAGAAAAQVGKLNNNSLQIGANGVNTTLTTQGTANLTLSTNAGTNSGTILINNGVNGNIELTPDGTGDVYLNADTVRVGDANAAATITTNGTGNLTIRTGSTNSGTILINQGDNGNIDVEPHGTGDVNLNADTVRVGDAGAAATITTNGTGNLTLSTNAGTNSGTILINQGANGNIVVAPNGTGDVQLDADTVRIGDAGAAATLTTNGAGNLTLSTNEGTNSGTILINNGANGNIELTPNGTGDVYLNADTVRVGDSNAEATIVSNGTGNLVIKTGSTNTGSITLTQGDNGAISVQTHGTGEVVINDAGNSSNVRVEGDTDVNLLFTQGSTDRVGIGTATPSAKLNVEGSVIINDGGADVDVRIEGDTDPNLFFTDASTDRVGVGISAPANKLHIQQTSAATNTVTDVLRLESQSSGTPASGIGVGLEFAVETTADNVEIGATIEAVTTDVTATSEDFDLVFRTMIAGAAAAQVGKLNNTSLQIGANGVNTTLTTQGTANLTLRTGSTNSGTILINQGDNANIVVTPHGTGDVQLDADTVRIGDSGAAATLTTNGAGNLTLSTNEGTNSGTILINQGANGNIVVAPNGTGDVQLDADTVRVGDANAEVTIVTNGTGNLVVKTGSTNTGSITLNQGDNGVISVQTHGTGEVVVNDAGNASDFRVEGDADANLFITDGSADRVGIGIAVPENKLHIQQTSAATNTVTRVLKLDSQSSGAPASGIGVGLEFAVETAAGNSEVGAAIEAVTTDVASTSEDFDLVFRTMIAGAAAAQVGKLNNNTLQIGADATATTITTQGNSNLTLRTGSTNSGSILINQGDNGNIDIEPHGTGDVNLNADTIRVGDSNAAATITTNGTGNLTLRTGSTNSGTILINQGDNGNIDVEPHNTGDVNLITDRVRIGSNNEDVNITTQGTGDITINTNAGTSSGFIKIFDGANQNIEIEPNGTGNLIVYTDTVEFGGNSASPTTAEDVVLTTRNASDVTINTNNGTNSGYIKIFDGVAGNIDIEPDTTGDVNLITDRVRIGSLNENVNVTTQGTGDITIDTNAGTSSGFIKIFDGANSNIEIQPNGTGVLIVNDAGTAVDVRVEGDNDVNLFFTDGSADRVAVGTDTPQNKLHVQQSSATTNAVTQVLRIDSQSTGTPANGIGVGMQFAVETTAGNTEVGATIEAVTTDVTATSEDFDLVFRTMIAGAAAAQVGKLNNTSLQIGANATATTLTTQGNSNLTIRTGSTNSGTLLINQGDNANIAIEPHGTGKLIINGSSVLGQDEAIASWTTSGAHTQFKSVTLTDTTSAAPVLPAVVSVTSVRSAVSMNAPTFASQNTGVIVANGATLYVENPIAGTNTTISNRYGIYNAGNEYIAGSLTVNGDAVFLSQSLSLNGKTVVVGNVAARIGVNATAITSAGGSGPFTAILTGVDQALSPGQVLTKTAGGGAFGTNTRVVSVSGSLGDFTVNVEADTAFTDVATPITFDVSGATDYSANQGGLVLKGLTDKTILWVDATDSWTFNQNIETTGRIKTGNFVQDGTLTGTLANTNQTAIDTSPHASVKSIKYIIEAKQGTSYQYSEIMVVNDGTAAYMVEYANVFTSANPLVSYDADINGANVRLLATAATASTTLKILKTYVV